MHHVMLGMVRCSTPGELIAFFLAFFLAFDFRIVEPDIRILQNQITIVNADRVIAEPRHIKGCSVSF